MFFLKPQYINVNGIVNKYPDILYTILFSLPPPLLLPLFFLLQVVESYDEFGNSRQINGIFTQPTVCCIYELQQPITEFCSKFTLFPNFNVCYGTLASGNLEAHLHYHPWRSFHCSDMFYTDSFSYSLAIPQLVIFASRVKSGEIYLCYFFALIRRSYLEHPIQSSTLKLHIQMPRQRYLDQSNEWLS